MYIHIRVFLIYLAIYDRTTINIEFCRFSFGIELLALSDNAMFKLTPGNDYFVLVFMWLTLDQTQLIHVHNLLVLPIYSVKSVTIEMGEKLLSVRP